MAGGRRARWWLLRSGAVRSIRLGTVLVLLPVLIGLVSARAGAAVTASPVVEYPLPLASSSPQDITKGPDGNVWFTDPYANAVGDVTPQGTVNEYAMPSTFTGQLNGIATGPDGRIWFTYFNRESGVGAINPSRPSQGVQLFDCASQCDPQRIVSGPSNSLWVTDQTGDGFIDQVNTSGVVVNSFPLPGIRSSTPGCQVDYASRPDGITVGPDGNLWFVQTGTQQIGEMTPTGVLTEHPIGGVGACGVPSGPTPPGASGPLTVGNLIATGPDGNLWFNSGSNNLTSLTTTGQMTTCSSPHLRASGPGNALALGPVGSGTLWAVNEDSNVYSFAPSSGVVSQYAIPTSTGNTNPDPVGVATGADGNVWFTDQDPQPGAVGKVAVGSSPSATEQASCVPSLSAPPPVVEWKPGAETFPTTAVGLDSGGFPFTLTNPGAGPVTVTSVGLAGPDPGDYQIRSNGCAGSGATVAPGGGCAVWVSFDPTAGGDRSATLVAVDSAGQQTAFLDGTGGSTQTSSCPIDLAGPSEPAYVVLLADGIGSKTSGGSYDPLQQSYCFPVASDLSADDSSLGPDGTPTPPPLKSILDDYLNGFWAGTQDQYLSNVLGGEGAVIVPFSYAGANFAGSNLVVNAAGSNLPGNLLPDQAALVMEDEVAQIQEQWPDAQIEIIGHSEGGLVAETWWQDYGIGNPQGVQNVFSLDSPINGVQDAFLCGHSTDTASLCQLGGVSAQLGSVYSARWGDQQSIDQQINSLDTGQRPWYFAVGTYGDPVYEPADYPNQGMISQVVLTGCSGFLSNDCSPARMDVSSACLPSQSGQGLGVGGHGLVMNCDNVISLEACFLVGQSGGCPLPWGGYTGESALPSSRLSSRALTRAAASHNTSPTTFPSLPAVPWGNQPRGSLSPPAAGPNSDVVIAGTNFGGSKGQILFSGGSPQGVPGTVVSWGSDQVGVTVPTGATSGPVVLVTSDGRSAEVGTLAVLGPTSSVRRLSVKVGSSQPWGQPVSVWVSAYDAQGHTVPNAQVSVLGQGGVLQEATGSNGTAVFALNGTGAEQFIASSGQAFATFTASWKPPANVSQLAGTTFGIGLLPTAACISGRSRGLTIGAGQVACVAPGATVSGPITIHKGGALLLSGGTVNGPIKADAPQGLAVCGATVHGPVQVSGASGPVVIGAGSNGCPGNTIRGPVKLVHNSVGILLEGDTVTGPVTLKDNAGSYLYLGGDHISGPLDCAGNAPAPRPTGAPDAVSGPEKGQCAGL